MAGDGALEWHKVANKAEILNDEPLGVEVEEQFIGLYLVDGEIYAMDNVCSHEFAILTDGFMEDECIECPIHQALFDVRTGKARSAPAEVDLKTYPVRVEGEDVFVGLPAK